MPEKTPLELLQPCLLDRLTDDDPEKKEESRRERVMSYKKYRDGVMRDLEWLLNTEGALRPESLAWLRASGRGPAGNVPDLREYPYAFRSVINYGLRQFWGLSDREKESLLLRGLKWLAARVIGLSLRMPAPVLIAAVAAVARICWIVSFELAAFARVSGKVAL